MAHTERAWCTSAYSDAYFGLPEALERLFNRPIDLVVATAIPQSGRCW
jgi:predicted nucleotidyltransferase